MGKEKFKEGARVFTYGFGYEQHKGTIYKNTDHPDVSEWYIKYDDGEECAVLDINGVYRLGKDIDVSTIDETENVLKEVAAYICLSVDVYCPHCDVELDIKDLLCEEGLTNTLDIPDRKKEIVCDECKGVFLVTGVDY